MGYARRIRTDYRRCARCGCSLDVSEGEVWPGEGLVCDDCGAELERDAKFRADWGISKEMLDWMKAERLYDPEGIPAG